MGGLGSYSVLCGNSAVTNYLILLSLFSDLQDRREGDDTPFTGLL